MAKLTLKQERFIDALIKNGGNSTEAVITAGYNVANRNTAGTIGYENLQKPAVKAAYEAKRADIAEVLSNESMNMLERLLELAYSSGTPAGVRAKALQDLLDRAGVSTTNKLSVTGEVNTTLTETRHTAEFAKRARELIVQMEMQKKGQD